MFVCSLGIDVILDTDWEKSKVRGRFRRAIYTEVLLRTKRPIVVLHNIPSNEPDYWMNSDQRPIALESRKFLLQARNHRENHVQCHSTWKNKVSMALIIWLDCSWMFLFKHRASQIAENDRDDKNDKVELNQAIKSTYFSILSYRRAFVSGS